MTAKIIAVETPNKSFPFAVFNDSLVNPEALACAAEFSFAADKVDRRA
jgi:hypothetical protein